MPAVTAADFALSINVATTTTTTTTAAAATATSKVTAIDRCCSLNTVTQSGCLSTTGCFKISAPLLNSAGFTVVKIQMALVLYVET